MVLIKIRILLWFDLFVLVLWLDGKVSGVLLCSLHTNQLHFSLGKAEYESREQRGDGQGIGEGQPHQAWKEQKTTYSSGSFQLKGSQLSCGLTRVY